METTYEVEVRRARALCLSTVALRRLRGLVAERGKLSWEVGDVLVAALGPPAHVHDGSGERIEAIADELGCSASWLSGCRAAAAAWPRRERKPTVAFAVSRALTAYPNRFALLDQFERQCHRDHVTPSLQRLTTWLDQQNRRPHLVRTGRPRADPTVKVERMAMALETEALERLIRSLQDALDSRRLAAA